VVRPGAGFSRLGARLTPPISSALRRPGPARAEPRASGIHPPAVALLVWQAVGITEWSIRLQPSADRPADAGSC
jgi:hypothetical protein